MSAEQVKFLTAEEAAEIVHLRPSTLKKHRQCGTGPRWFLAGRRALYRAEDLLAWVQECRDRYQQRADSALEAGR